MTTERRDFAYEGLLFFRNGKEVFPAAESDLERSSTRHAVVLGSARGGTTACAKILSAFGFVTDDANEFSESKAFKRYLTVGRGEEILTLLASWDADTERRYIKEPKLKSDTFRDLLQAFPGSICFVIVFRDTLNIALRNFAVMGVPFPKALMDAGRDQVKLASTVASLHNRDVALISYEKLITYPERTVHRLAHFLGVGEASAIGAAVRAIEPNSREYELAVQLNGEPDKS